MVAFLCLRCFQGYFITLVVLFERVGLWNNSGKTFGMVFCLCQAAGTQSDVAYGRRMMGEGPSYWDQQRGRVQCKECGEEMVLGLLPGHMQTQHGRSEEDIPVWVKGGTTRFFIIGFFKV